MSHAMDSKSAAAMLDPFNAPEPSQEDGPGGSGFGSTFAPASKINGITSSGPNSPSSSSNNPYRASSSSVKQTPSPKYSKHAHSKSGASASVRSSSGSPRPFPNYRAEAFGGDEAFSVGPRRNRAESHGTPPTYQEATSSTDLPANRPRRVSSLKERYPGDKSNQPLDIIRRDSKKAYKSHHLHKRSIPGADSIDRLDPAIGGRAYHHEGPYDAALLARNRDQKTGPLYALEDSNQEALKATPRENIKEAVERHRPLDGTAIVPPGVPDRFGRRYQYEEGADLMHEPSSADAGYKRWPNQDYSPEDLKGKASPTFDLDRALKAHKIDENSAGGIELQDRSRISREYHDAERRGELDPRDPVDIAGGEERYADLEIAQIRKSAELNSSTGADAGMSRGGIRGSIKKRIGSLKKKNREEEY